MNGDISIYKTQPNSLQIERQVSLFFSNPSLLNVNLYREIPFSSLTPVPSRSAFTMAKEQFGRPDGSDRPPSLKTPPEHEESVLQFFALHRVATPYHVMRAFPQFYKYHNKVMRHLDWLADAGYLMKHEFNGRFRSYIYNITESGYERCRDIPKMDLRRIPYSYDEPKGKQALHEVQITETAVSIYEYIRSTPTLRMLEEGRFMLRSEPAFEHLIPDYWYLALDQRGLMVRFIEMIAGEESGTRIRQMFEEYESWGQRDEVQRFLQALYSHYGAREAQPEFEVHCILHNRNWNHTDAWKERMTLRQTFEVSPEMQGRVWTTTNDALSSALDEGRGINDAIWHRGRDLLGDIRRTWAHQPKARGRYLDACMKAIPTHSLFAA